MILKGRGGGDSFARAFIPASKQVEQVGAAKQHTDLCDVTF